MPIYEYKCPQCNTVFEEWVKSHDTGPQNCPDCGTAAPHIVSNTSFVLKGGGWYVTEYGNKKSTDSSPSMAPAAKTADGAAESATATAPATASDTSAAPAAVAPAAANPVAAPPASGSSATAA